MLTRSYLIFAGCVLIIAGTVYLIKPNIFRRGIWMKTGIAERNLSPRAYKNYARAVGVFQIAVGIALLAWAWLKA